MNNVFRASRLVFGLLALAACSGPQGAGSSDPPVTTVQASSGAAMQCKVREEGVFAADDEGVRRVSVGTGASFSVFRAPLAVNTDGAPNSYHPMDPLGERLAINRFDNGITVRERGRTLSAAEKRQRFEAWRDSGWVLPQNTSISWKNVIAAQGEKPCVFTSGPYQGYFGSLTSLPNGLSGAAAGECGVNNSIDLRNIPAIALRGGKANPLTTQGAVVGDLVLAVNPKTGVAVPAIIADSGDGKRIGEGSVALNMALLGTTTQPKTYNDSKRLDTGIAAMVIAVLPGTRDYARERPYSAANIAARVEQWAAANGYLSTSALAQAAMECSNDL